MEMVNGRVVILVLKFGHLLFMVDSLDEVFQFVEDLLFLVALLEGEAF